MVVANQAPANSFIESLHLLKRLHLLSLVDNDQGDEADGIREAMERLWWRLSDVERERLDGLSADLYSIGESRAVPARVDDQTAKLFEKASASGNWDEALETLRCHESELPPADVAAMRGVAWGSLGHHNIAALFFAEAVRLKPDDFRLKCLYLRSLIRAGDCQRAKQEAAALGSTSHQPLDLLLAADVLFDCEQADAVAPNRESFARIAALAERALKSWNAESASGALSRVAGAGFLSGAISLAIIGEDARSDALYAIAQALLPDFLPVIARSSQRNRGDSIAPLLQTKYQVDAQLLLSI